MTLRRHRLATSTLIEAIGIFVPAVAARAEKRQAASSLLPVGASAGAWSARRWRGRPGIDPQGALDASIAAAVKVAQRSLDLEPREATWPTTDMPLTSDPLKERLKDRRRDSEYR